MPSKLLAGRYELLDLVGSGRQGEVYRAKDHWDSSTVALKLLADGTTGKDIAVWAELNHPNIVRVLDVGFTNGKPHLSLEYAQGPTLREAYLSGGEPILLSLAADICLALQTVHSRGICHGDLKPANILVEEGPDDSLRAKITDLGLWRLVGAESEGFSGTLAYAAPEVLKGEVPDQRSDLYSLGACLYEVITGKPVFECDDLHGIVRAHIEETPTDPRELNPSISDKLATIVLSLLAKEPTRRASSAGEVLDRLGVGREFALPREPAWVGRQRELRFIKRLEELASEGKGNLALVVGEDGIGKTTLLERVCKQWSMGGGGKLQLHCGEGAEGRDLVQGLLLRADAMVGIEEQVADLREPGLAAKRFVDSCGAASEDRPVLVVLEDLGRADASFLRFIGALVPLVAGERMLVIASVDRQGLSRVKEAIPKLAELPQVRRILFRSFTEHETERLVASLTCRKVTDKDLVRLVHRLSGGNPGLVGEAIRYLAAQGHLRRSPDGWRVASLPEAETIESWLGSVVEVRIHGLSSEQQRVVGALGLVGRGLPEDALTEVTGFDDDRLGEVLKGLEKDQIVTLHGEQWAVRNRAIGRAGMSVLSEEEEAELHAAAARMIESRWPDDPAWRVSLVRHLLGRGREEDAYDRAVVAARRAFDQSEYGIALELYDLAERCLREEHTERKIVVWKGQALCYQTLGRPQDSIERLTSLLGLPETSDLTAEETADLRLSLARALASQCRFWEASEQLDAVLAASNLPQKLEAEALSTAVSVANKAHKSERAEQLARKLLQFLSGSSDAGLLAGAEAGLGWALLTQGRLEGAYAHLERGYRFAEKAGDTLNAGKYAYSLAWLHIRHGRYEEAREKFRVTVERSKAAAAVEPQAAATAGLGIVEQLRGFPRQSSEWFEQAEELATRCGAWRYAAQASLGVALAKRAIGEWGQAVERLRELLTLERRRGNDLSVWEAANSLAGIYMEIGDLEAVEGWCNEARRISERQDDKTMIGSCLCDLARVSRERGNLEEARTHLNEAIEALESSGMQRQVLRARCEEAELMLAESKSEEALAVAEKAAAEVGEEAVWDKAVALRTLGRVRARAGKHEEAGSAFAQCLELVDGTDFVEEIAFARLEVGRWLAVHGQEPGFRAAEWYLTHAREIFERLGARPWVEDAEELLRVLTQTPVAGLSLPMEDAQRLASLYRMVAIVNSAKTSGGLLEQILDLALHAVCGERGLVILVDKATGELLVKAKTEVDNGTIADARRISETVVKDVAGAGDPVFSPDALSDVRFSEYESIHLNRIACFMCVPLTLRDKILGTIYVDSQNLDHRFCEDDVCYLRAFAHQAAIAMENVRFREELERDKEDLERQLQGKYAFDTLVGCGPKMEEVCRAMTTVVDNPVTVLIQGETGTGKELIARAIHHNGPRSKGKFVAVNCGALPDTLLESELFGHVKGAFTGAVRNSPGVFQLADGGTIFLDEISDMSPSLQARLLRVLQTGEVKQLGKAEAHEVDVRVISATNKDLGNEMRAGRFREDLYYRLKVVAINLPPLRERREDIPLLATHFLEQCNERLGKRVRAFSEDAMTYLCKRPWPGNVRELEHLVEAATVLSPGRVIDVDTLCTASGSPAFGTAESPPETGMTYREAQRSFEKRYIRSALEDCGWNISNAAKRIGLVRQQVQRMMRRHGLERPKEVASA